MPKSRSRNRPRRLRARSSSRRCFSRPFCSAGFGGAAGARYHNLIRKMKVREVAGAIEEFGSARFAGKLRQQWPECRFARCGGERRADMRRRDRRSRGRGAGRRSESRRVASSVAVSPAAPAGGRRSGAAHRRPVHDRRHQSLCRPYQLGQRRRRDEPCARAPAGTSRHAAALSACARRAYRLRSGRRTGRGRADPSLPERGQAFASLRRDTLQSALPQYGFPSRSVDRGGGLADRGRRPRRRKPTSICRPTSNTTIFSRPTGVW